MGTTIRCRFVALDLAAGWIELRRKGLWTLKHPERRGTLTLSMFPVAEGVQINLATLEALSRERELRHDELMSRAPRMRTVLPRSLLLDHTAWLQDSVFCHATSVRTDSPSRVKGPTPWPFTARVTYRRTWTVSDGAYVVEATLYEYDEEHFRIGVEAGDAMMRSVRFEGPS